MAATAGTRALGKGDVAQRRASVSGIAALVALQGVSAVLSLVVAPPGRGAGRGPTEHVRATSRAPRSRATPASFVVFTSEHRVPEDEEDAVGRVAAACGRDRRPVHLARDRAGMLWGKPVWGTWWTWDPRLTTDRRAAHDLRRLPRRSAGSRTTRPRRARWAAVIGIVGFIDVPIVHLSGRVVAFAAPGADAFRLGRRDRGDDAPRAARQGRGVHDHLRLPDDAPPRVGASRSAPRARRSRRSWGRTLMAPNAGYVIAGT